MTISYQRDVASSTAGGFTRLLFKWKGSLYKLIYRELLLFLSAYILLSLLYRQILTQNQRGLFHSIACFVDGFDQDSRILRRSLMRYMNLALILVLRSISSAVKQRFPTLDHVVEAGFMTNQEKELFQAVPSNEFNTYWIPCTWFIYRIQEASKNNKLVTHYALETIMREFCEFRAKCGLLWCYDWVSIPMVYTQVVTLATYVFFIFTVIGRQKIDTLKKGEYMRSGRMPMDIDLYIPIFTVLQFFFYMGLLKVAEQLINPFGDDDEDFELNWLVDRHMKASFLGCDILMDPDRIPPMVKDFYWDKQNCPIPYTEASMHFKRKTYKGSADDMIIPESKQHMVLPEIEEEDDNDKRQSRLSLTSLLLESTSQLVTSTGLGIANSVQTSVNRKRSIGDLGSSQVFHPGAWRNGGHLSKNNNTTTTRRAELLGIDSNDYEVPVRRTSYESVNLSEDNDYDARYSSKRRSSRISNSSGFEKKKNLSVGGNNSSRRKKTKQGFVWRRMVHDTEDLPKPRTPHLGLLPDHRGAICDSVIDESRTKSSSLISVPVPLSNSTKMDDENISVNSFRTCPSDPNLIGGLNSMIVPRSVSENYDLSFSSTPFKKVSQEQSVAQSGTSSNPSIVCMSILPPQKNEFCRTIYD
ncbi:bestrophin-2a isoform X3 [Lepeophtheirus salmonis]|uniref:bestrophin-2a isoform X3 n=1 Tax=Lepeophtheirus salmonis TaxID=72036 RepID=UPI001AE90F73|nr:bestrophin-2-like isoform X3 [Lepeophtheirus salmonis]